MRPFYTVATNLIQGLLISMALVVLADVASPTFNVEGIPGWTGGQATVIGVVVLTVSLALGVVMHTISRSLFHKQKKQWTLNVLASRAMRNRLAALGAVQTTPGGPVYEELAEDSADRVRKAAAFMDGMEYQVMLRAPAVYSSIQAYRHQYRMARAFILPCIILAIVLPFWAPVAALDGAGTIGPLPIIRSQAFLLSVLAAAVSFVAFRERAYRYIAAKALAWVTLEGVARKEHDD